MSNSLDEIKDATTKILRRAAAHYGDAATEYGHVLAAYSKGNADAVEVAKTGFNLALREAQSLVENGVALSGAYYRWAFSLIGVRPLSESQPPSPPAKKDRTGKA
jgi:hypothetical protein